MASPINGLMDWSATPGASPANPLAAVPIMQPNADNPLMAYGPTLADAWQANAKAYGDWSEQQRVANEATYQADLAKGYFDPKTGARTDAGWGALGTEIGQAYGSAMIGGTSAPGMKGPGFTAYHGSPHSFDAFKSEAIGTGEGAQAYGHGLYVAQSEKVAQGYRDRLSPSGVEVFQGGESKGMLPNMQIINDPKFVDAYNSLIPADVPGWIKSAAMRDIAGNVPAGQAVDLAAARSATLARMAKEVPSPKGQQPIFDAVNKAYDSIGSDVQFKAPGHMYEVNINADPAHFLDWDKPLSQQSPHVQEALGQFGITPRTYAVTPKGDGYGVTFNDGATMQRTFATAEDAHKQASLTARMSDPTGGAVYEHSKLVPGDYRDPAAAAQALQAAGIPGIRYLDGGSRSNGEGTSNTVVFDANSIRILRKYGIAGLMAGGAAAAQSGDPPTP